jgi:hypothetical protein
MTMSNLSLCKCMSGPRYAVAGLFWHKFVAISYWVGLKCIYVLDSNPHPVSTSDSKWVAIATDSPSLKLSPLPGL